MTFAYAPENDLPGGGFNFISFYNEEWNQLQEDQRNPALTNGCDLDARRPMVQAAQQILFDEVAYIYLGVANVMFAMQPSVEGFDPLPFSRLWNIDAWSAVEP